MSELPSIHNYGEYSNDNYGAHTLMVEFEGFRLYYSYKTIVAYFDYQDRLVCCENVWGPTTGKHLNWIQANKHLRVKADKFDEMLQAMLVRHTQ